MPLFVMIKFPGANVSDCRKNHHGAVDGRAAVVGARACQSNCTAVDKGQVGRPASRVGDAAADDGVNGRRPIDDSDRRLTVPLVVRLSGF